MPSAVDSPINTIVVIPPDRYGAADAGGVASRYEDEVSSAKPEK